MRSFAVAHDLQKGYRANRLLAALEAEDLAYLEPLLEVVTLPKGTVLYESGEIIRYTYFPHDAIVSLVEVMADGRPVEVGMFGRDGLCGLVSAAVTREAFGRYVVHIPGSASRIAIERMQEAITVRPNIRRIILRFTEALFAQTLQTVACNAIHSVEERCCRWILSTRDRMD